MSYWRIRKEWNNGKWDKTQKGAFTSLESAIENFKEEYKNEGYKIFSPSGEILYPHHDLTQMLLNDEISLDEKYWDETFKLQRLISYDYAIDIFKQYSNLLKDAKELKNQSSNSFEVINYNGLEIYKIPTDLIKIKVVDKTKKNIEELSYVNAGYFANYLEFDNVKNIRFTLPVANLVADYNFDELPKISHKYWKERKHTSGKMYFGANDNGPDFYGKEVSTLIIYDNSLDIVKINDIKLLENVKYAVSGYPLLLNNQEVSYKEALAEGWSSGVTRNTAHVFVGLKENDNNHIYLFGLITKYLKEKMTPEVLGLVDKFGFKSLIKLDGGGSAIIKIDNDIKLMTSENRQINSIITIG